MTQGPGNTHFADIRPPSLAEADPYAELKKAHAEGNVIQYNCGSNAKPEWEDLPLPTYEGKPHEYRIKPEPETFEAHGKTWTRHTPGAPMPCDGEAFVDCFCEGGGTLLATRAKLWSWSGDLIGWRYADEPTPAQPATLPLIDVYSGLECHITPDGIKALKPAWQPAVGELVRLKSGGPVMTVEYVKEDEVDVVWINTIGDMRRPRVAITCLTPAKEEQP
jgi:uncharacterized protein YodC (DUF2158 family)